MSDDLDLLYFKRMLLQKREEILMTKGDRQQLQQTVELDQARVGRLSRMDAMQQQAMAQATQRNDDLMLLRIESALNRCDDGSFGICCVCDGPIAIKRLQIDPTSFKCIECAQLAD